MKFNILKGIGKFLLGALGVLAGIVAQNPSVLTIAAPQLMQMTVGGFIVELADYIHNQATKKGATP